MKYHPDKNNGADVKFKEVHEAYDFMKDPANRKEYCSQHSYGRTLSILSIV